MKSTEKLIQDLNTITQKVLTSYAKVKEEDHYKLRAFLNQLLDDDAFPWKPDGSDRLSLFNKYKTAIRPLSKLA